MKHALLAAAAAMIALASAAQAEPGAAQAGDLRLVGAHARVILPTRPAAAYLIIENKGPADRLIGASSPAFGRVELHTHLHEDGLMRMVEVEAIEIPAGGGATLRSGGDHIMLFEMKEPLAAGDEIPLTLTFERGGDVAVVAPIKPIAQSGAPDAARESGGQGQGKGAGHGGHGGHGHAKP